jgi:hypothetical protein
LRIIIELDEGKTTTATTIPSGIRNVEIVGIDAQNAGSAPILSSNSDSLETSYHIAGSSSSFDKQQAIDAGPPAQSLLEIA